MSQKHLLRLGGEHLRAGRLVQAELLCLQALEADPAAPDAHLVLGLALHGQGRPEEALRQLRRAAALAPDSFDAQNNLGGVLVDLRRGGEAQPHLERAIALQPGNPVALTNLGNALQLQGRTDKAIDCYGKALAGAPGHVAAHYNLGAALSDWGKLDEAVSCFEAARKLNPNVAEIHNNLGTALQGLGRLEEATASLRAALALDPACVEAQANLHALLLDADNLAPAIDCLRKAVALRPADLSMRFLLGALLELSGDAQAAAVHLETVASGGALDRARLESWRYMQSACRGRVRLIGSPVEAFRVGMAAAKAEGLVLEFGVRFGTSLRQIAALAKQPVHGFDSFQGLPEDWHAEPRGSYSTGGALPGMPDNVTLHAGWFEETLPAFLARHPGAVRFMNIDCDLYSSTRSVLGLLADRIIAGTVIVFDEYLLHQQWREDEFRAFQETVASKGWRYEYLCFGLTSKQAVVRIL